MTQIERIQKSIDHWKKMIEWVKKQPPENRTNYPLMMDTLKMGWGSIHCHLCHLYADFNTKCTHCPLQIKFGVCCGDDVDNEWARIDTSRIWGEWLAHAEVLLEQLISLLPSEKEKYDALIAVCHMTINMIQEILDNLKKELI